MTNPLSTLEQDLNTLATPDSSDPQNGTATASSALTAAQAILSLLADQSLVGTAIGPAVAAFYTAIANAIDDDVVKALQAIAQELGSLNVDGNDAAAALTALQNALQTAGSLVPGGSAAVTSALAATTQFTTLFGNLLSNVGGDLGQAATQLYEIAQQLAAIATAFSNAAAGNP
jgi:hypothetical protein